MSWLQVYASGLGQSLGDSLVTSEPFYTTEDVWYVYSATGVDAAAPNGRSPAKPFATLGYAISASAVNDVIVLMDGHAETLTSAVVPLVGQMIIGGGSSGGKPTVKLTMNAAAAGMFTVSNEHVCIRNIWFNTNAQANTVSMVKVTKRGFRMKDCYFECGQYNDNYALELFTDADYASVDGTRFVSTATVLTAQPYTAMGITSSALLEQISMVGSSFDGGTVGFSSGYGLLATSQTEPLILENLSLLRGADVGLGQSVICHTAGITSDSSAAIRWDTGV